MTDLVTRLRERAAGIARANNVQKERFQSKTALLLLEGADMIDLLRDDVDQLHDICDHNEAEVKRLRKELEGK